MFYVLGWRLPTTQTPREVQRSPQSPGPLHPFTPGTGPLGPLFPAGKADNEALCSGELGAHSGGCLPSRLLRGWAGAGGGQSRSAASLPRVSAGAGPTAPTAARPTASRASPRPWPASAAARPWPGGATTTTAPVSLGARGRHVYDERSRQSGQRSAQCFPTPGTGWT